MLGLAVRQAVPQDCRLRGRVSEFLPVYKKGNLARLAWRPTKHVRDRGHVPFVTPADLIPRSLSTPAIDGKLVVPAAWIARIAGSTVWANSFAALIWIARPLEPARLR
jgi:hypothetical protein